MSYIESFRSVNRQPASTSAIVRSWIKRFLFFKKLSFFQWTCSVAVFLSLLLLVQIFLPVSLPEHFSASGGGGGGGRGRGGGGEVDALPEGLSSFLKGLEFGEDVKFEPLMSLERFRKAKDEEEEFNATRRRFWIRKPKIALLFGDLVPDPTQLMMVTIATALRDIGYDIEVYSPEDGPVKFIWERIGVPVTLYQFNQQMQIDVDWLTFDSIIVNSLEARSVFPSFMQEPFKSLPLIWIIHEDSLAIRSRQYISSWQIGLVNDWKKLFNRSTVVVFPNHVLPMMYSSFDVGNYHVIPGTPTEVWEAEIMMMSSQGNMRLKMGYQPDDVIIAIVGSHFFYSGLWLEHALILQTLLPLFQGFQLHSISSSRLNIIVLSGISNSNYGMAIEAIAGNLSYPRAAVKHMAVDENVGNVLSVVDLVIYGSFLEEQSFPEILIKAMSIGKPIVAPDLSMIRKHVHDRVNGYLFPKDNMGILAQIVAELISKGRLSPLGSNVTLLAKNTVKNLMAFETVLGYACLLENVLNFPSEVALPMHAVDISPNLKQEWSWDLFSIFMNSDYKDRISRSNGFLEKVEEEWKSSQKSSPNPVAAEDQLLIYDIWEEERNMEILNSKWRKEEEEIKDRTDQPRGTWDDVYRLARRADHAKNDLHERDEGELERTGQPLCIYEPYFGEGAWSFLHLRSLYRGIGLSTKGRRPMTDDVDAASHLPLLNNVYYQDVLGEYGAFFAIANRVDRIHKNAWIGFQSWRATARKASLSRDAEKALLGAIEARRHGDALYFWARMDNDPRNVLQLDFWSFCDAVNAGNCRFAFSEAFKRMYDLNYLPPMPDDGDAWAVMQSWALPTRSFLEFVMFSRMFVDALDAQMYEEHHRSGRCYLSLSKDKHCYSRVLELLINVWAYHSARVMVYVNPETGLMEEQHKLMSRRGKMWLKWFSYGTLKSMDEEMAEVADSDPPKTRRWLWPSTGEVVWQGVFETERNERNIQKEKKKQQSKEKHERMRRRRRQKVIGKYVRPLTDVEESSNSTISTTNEDESMETFVR